jgi:hypothetical protein
VANPIDIKKPERCLLIQALLWVSRGQLPVDDEAFVDAPDHLEESDLEHATQLVRCLRVGQINASGDLTVYYQPDLDPYEDAPKSSTIENYEPPPTIFTMTSIDFHCSTADVTRYVFVPPGGAIPKDIVFRKNGGSVHPTEGGAKILLERVTVPTKMLFELFPSKNKSAATDKTEILRQNRSGTIADEKKCTEWLTKLMKNGRPEHSKKKYFNKAEAEFGVSRRGFDRAWANAASTSGNTQWTNPGRKS